MKFSSAPQRLPFPMATSSKFPTPKQEAASETTSPDRLQELVKQSTELARLVAKNPNAAPNLLQELASKVLPVTIKPPQVFWSNLQRIKVVQSKLLSPKILIRLGTSWSS